MTTLQTKPNRKTARRERYAFHVDKGCLCPADSYTTTRLREKGYKVGDLLFADLTKPRNPGFYRLAHRIGALCAANIQDFAGMEAHAILKRIQWEAGIGCDEMGVQVPGVGLAMVRIPRSLGYESMDQGEFHEVTRAFCRHIASQYWRGMSEDQIAEMAESFVGEV